MKATYIIATIFALIGLGIVIGCQDDDLATSETSTTISADAQYMALSISMGTTSTRGGTGVEDLDYESGVGSTENYIDASKSVLLFYDEAGGYLTYGTLTSNIGWTTAEQSAVDSSVLVSLTPVSVTPSYVLCVFNYGDDWQGDLVGKDYGEAKKVTTETTPSKAGEFVISNAVINGNSTLSHLVGITSDNLCSTESEAQQNPVEVYVEREIAKVRIGLGSSSDKNAIKASGTDTIAVVDTLTYRTYISEGDSVTTGDKVAVTVTIKGWSVNATNPKGYVTKNYNDSESKFTNYPWYDKNNPYSLLWAVDANYTSTDGYTTDLEYLSWNDIADGGCADSLYIHENTADYAWTSGYNSADGDTVVTPAVVVAGELGIAYTDGSKTDEITAETLYKCNGILYDSLGIVQTLITNLGLYTDANTTTRFSVGNGLGSISFTRVSTDTNVNAYNAGRVVVAACDSTTTLYKADGTQFSGELADTLNALSYIKSGDAYMLTRYVDNKCYYQALIQQISSSQDSDDGPVYGVVRNNLYKLTLNSISGLGNAVNDPDEDITTIPQEDNTFYMACKVYILKWVSHSQTIDF